MLQRNHLLVVSIVGGRRPRDVLRETRPEGVVWISRRPEGVLSALNSCARARAALGRHSGLASRVSCWRERRRRFVRQVLDVLRCGEGDRDGDVNGGLGRGFELGCH